MKTKPAGQIDSDAELREANSFLALGAGLGALGTGTALLAGATCPLCVIAAPALIGVGVWKRFAASRKYGAPSKPENLANEDNHRQSMKRQLDK